MRKKLQVVETGISYEAKQLFMEIFEGKNTLEIIGLTTIAVFGLALSYFAYCFFWLIVQ